MEQDPIVRQRERIAYSNRFVTVYDDDVTMPDGASGTYLRIVESDGRPGVAVLPIANGQIGLVQTFRYPLGEWEWSIPRGFGDFDEPSVSARSELSEELGREPDELVALGVVAPNSGLLSSKVHLFLARYSHAASLPLDRNEVHGVRWVAFARLRDEISKGLVIDCFTLSAVSLAILGGHLSLS